MRTTLLLSALCVLVVALPQDGHDHDHDSHDHDSHDDGSGVIDEVHESLVEDYTSTTVTATAAVIDEIHDSLIDEFTMTADVADVDSASIIDEIHETMVENFTDDAALATATASSDLDTADETTSDDPPVQTTAGAYKKAPMIGAVVGAVLFVAKFM